MVDPLDDVDPYADDISQTAMGQAQGRLPASAGWCGCSRRHATWVGVTRGTSGMMP